MKNYVLLTIYMMFIFSLISFVPASHAQSNSNLYVSAENTLFENHFAGPMIIEVIIDDSDISSVSNTVEEPNVTVDNKKLNMVQAEDGKWYGYFGDKSQIQLADSLVGLAGVGLDFGEICQNTSPVAGTVSIASSGIVIPRDITSASNGNEDAGTCNGGISPSDSFVNNVLRNTTSPNTQITSVGQVGLESLSWPFIQLYEFDTGSTVEIKYDKENQEQTVDLIFDENEDIVKLETTLEEYRSGQEIKIIISDPFLNIDPTNKDSWTWSSGSSEGSFYQSFDENGDKDADGTAGHVDVSNSLMMWFDQHGQFSINPNVQNYDEDVLVLQDNKNTVLVDIDGSGYTPFDLGTASIQDPTEYPITFIETSSNSGIFVNYDVDGKANLRVNDNIPNFKSGSFEYSGKSITVLIESGTPPTAVDDRVSTSKNAAITIDVLDNDVDAQNNPLLVSLVPSSIEGTVVVNEDSTITYTPDSDFIGTETFDYMIDDIYDGTDTASVKVDVNPGFNAASINQITVYSDKSNYAVGDTVNTNWVIPNDASGTDTTILVNTEMGTTKISDTFSNSTEYEVSTDDFVEGTYTIRIEHGQYYGEKSVLFAESTQTVESTTTSEETSGGVQPVSDSCTDDSKLSTSVGKTSYTKGDKISISFELCDVVSNEYIITQILDPFNAPLTVDQFLPEGDDFDKEYSTAGGVWKVDGKYTVKSTYFGATAESTFNFIVPEVTEPKEDTSVTKTTVDSADTIASFVDEGKDPQYYVDRYNNEPSYKEWFEKNYPQYDSIYDAVGLDESESNNNSGDLVEDSSSTNNSESQSTTKSEQPTCGAGTELVNGLCQVVKDTTNPTCGAGTELVNGLCQVVKTGKVSQETSFVDSIFGFFKKWF